MARPKRSETIISKMEVVALELLKKCEEPEANIDLKMDVFRTIADWVKIKSKLEDDDGGAIAEYKRRLAGEDSERPQRRVFGGSRLTALKSSLPDTDDSKPDGDSNDAVGKVSSAA